MALWCISTLSYCFIQEGMVLATTGILCLRQTLLIADFIEWPPVLGMCINAALCGRYNMSKNFHTI